MAKKQASVSLPDVFLVELQHGCKVDADSGGSTLFGIALLIWFLGRKNPKRDKLIERAREGERELRRRASLTLVR